MKKPQRRGTAITPVRRQGWIDTFQGYRHVIAEIDVQNWLNQFAEEHKDLAARILDSVEFVSPDATDGAYRNLLAALPGWDIDPAQRNGIWKFAAFTSSPGESGDRMLHQFRNANNLAGQNHNNLFAYRSELASLGKDDTVVFIDDFSGSGNQVTDYWPTLEEVLANGPTAYLVLIGATTTAQGVISANTSLNLRAAIVLDKSDDVFASVCTHFSNAEKEVLLTYCKRASRNEPKGHAACGLILVLAHKAPNNSISVLHQNNNRWTGLFRRYN